MKKTDKIPQQNGLKQWSRMIALVIVFGITHVAKAQEISPLLVGNNAWFTNPTDEVWTLTKDCGVKTIRIGGNGFNDNMPSNETILGWVKKIRSIGAEPIVQVSQHQSAAVAASLVQFLNVEKSNEIAPVKYWNIGNEPWLEANRPPTSTVGPMVEAYFKPIAAAMKEVDSSIKIFGFDEAYYMEDAIDALFGGANDIAGKIPGKDYYYCDGLSWHRYPQDDNINLAYQGIEDFKTSIVKCKAKVDAVNAAYNRTGDNALQWGIGEYNAKNGPVVHTWENGQMFGGILGLCMKYGATYAATWSMFENGGSRTGSDYSFIDGANMTPRSSYRHMQFVAQHFTGNYLDGTTSNEDIFIYGAQNGNKTSVMIMNRESGAPLKYTLHLNQGGTTGDHVVLTVNGNNDQTYSDIIGERTTHVLIFEGEKITKINYSDIHFNNELAPVESELGSATEIPLAPSNLNGIGLSFNEIQLAWTDNAMEESGFIIERGTGDVFEIIALVDANVTSFADRGLNAETSYNYRILAYNGLGESEYSNVATASTTAIPAQKAYNGPHVLPGRIQSEDYNDNGQGLGYYDTGSENQGAAYRTGEGVDVQLCTDDGGGYNVGWVSDGEWLNYTIDQVTAGEYNFAIRLASNTTGTKKITISLDDEVLGSVTPTNTGGWQVWQTLYLNDISLDQGENQLLKLSFEGAEYNINWFEFVDGGVPTSTKDDLVNTVDAYYNSLNHTVQINLSAMTRRMSLAIFDLSGRLYLEKENTQFIKGEFDVSSFSKGIYILNIATAEAALRKKIWVH